MKLTVDFTKSLGSVKRLHEVGQPPFSGSNTANFKYLTDAHVKYSRLHDTGGMFGGGIFVDIPNVFRDFNADVDDPASYDFAFTDWLIGEMEKAGLEPIYRLGVTIENYHNIKQYRLDPPSDPMKWARICEHIVRHYNEGWANGFRYGIKFWEIWNEPDNGRTTAENAMWYGTPEQYYELYAVTAKHLKKCFGDSIMVGGYASCGFYAVTMDPAAYGMADEAQSGRSGDVGLTPDRYRFFVEFFEGFFAYIKKENAPIDFFSWHSYADVPSTCLMADYVEKKLNEYGYGDLYTMCNEWNNASERKLWTTVEAGAKLAAMLCGMAYHKIDMMCYYDARIGLSGYGGLFEPMNYAPTPAYYALKAYGELFALGTAHAAEGCDKGVYALAASDGSHKALLVSNISGCDKVIETELIGAKVCLIDAEHKLTECKKDAACFELKDMTAALVVWG